MDTSTTTYTPAPELTAGVIAHGLMAIGMHMAEQPLPRPLQLHLPGSLRDRFEIHVMDFDAEAWVDTLEVDDVETRPQPGPDFPDGCPRYARHHFGRLPNSGVRVDVFCLVAHSHHLQAVPS